MAGSAQALVLKFNADTAPAKRAFTELAQTGASQMALLAGAAAASGKKIDGGLLGTLARLAAGITGAQLAYAGFAAVAAASIGIAIDKLGEYRKILADANSAGVSTDFFQKFTQSAAHAVESARLLEAALKTAKGSTREGLDGSTVGNRIDEFSRNGGFTAAGEAAREAYKNAADTEAKIVAALRAIDNLRDIGRTLEAADLAGKLFGPDAADALIARADKAGKSLSEMVNATADKKVVSPEQIENARQLEDRLEKSRKTMADGMRPILEDLERLGTALYAGWVNTEEAIAKAVKTVGALYSAVKSVVALLPAATENVAGAVTATAEARLASLNTQISNLEKGGFDPRLSGLRQQRDQLQGQANAARGQQQLRDDAVPVIPFNAGPVQIGPNDPLARIGARPPRRPITDFSTETKAKSGGGGSSTDSDLEFYEKYVASIEKAIAALKTEADTLGLSTLERERATLSSKAYAEFKAKDIELSDEQKAKIDQLIDAQARLKAQLEDTKNAMQAQRELVQFLGTNVSSFLSDLASGGKNASEAMMQLAKRLADAGLQAALLGQGPLAGILGLKGQNGEVGGIFGALFRGVFSGFGTPAGWTGTGGSFDVGSRYIPRDMPAYVHQGEMILTRGDADRLRSGRAGSGSGVTISQSYDFRGSSVNETQVRAMVDQGMRRAIASIEEKQLKYGSSYGRGL